jgi:LPS-assembly protein
MIRGAAIAAVALALGAAGGSRAATEEQPAGKPAAPGPATLAISGGAEPVNVEADSMVYDWANRVVRLDGHVIVTRGEGIMRAGRGVLDRNANTLRLTGGVLAVQGHQVALADAALLDLTSRAADLSRAVLYLKQSAPPTLRNLTDARLARGMGKNALTLTATRIEQLPLGRIVARDVTLTPCDCEGSPDYEIESSEARVGEDRVALSSPWLHIGRVSIPLFPLSLPLGDRQSGMLFPNFGFTAATGFAFAVPVFFTLGRSYDATVTPGFFTGSPGTGSTALNERSVKGPRLGLELRYAPAQATQGELSFDFAEDLDRNAKVPAGTATDAPRQLTGEKFSSPGRGLPGANGLRGILRFTHRTQEGPFALAAQSTLETDVMALPDLEPAQIERVLGSLPTDVGAWAAVGPLSAGIDATVLQDTRINNFAFPDRRLFGPEARPYPARLPAAFLQLAPLQAGPLALSTEVSAVRFQILGGPAALEHDTGYSPTDIGVTNIIGLPNGTAAIPTADPQGLARASGTRLDIAPRLSAALPAGLPIWGRVEAGARADAWIFENDPARDTRRAYGLAGASAGTTLSRAYGPLLHTVSPLLELRAITRALRSGGPPIGDPTDAGGSSYSSNPDAALQGIGPGVSADPAAGGNTRGVPASRRPYDEVDFAAPESGAGEASLRLLQSLWAKGPAGRAPTRVASLELRQDLVLWLPGSGQRVAEASAIASLNVGAFGAQTLLRYDWAQRALTTASAAASLRDARGDDVHTSLLVLNGTPGARARAGIDELFAAAKVAPLNPVLTYAVGGLTMGGNWVLPVAHDTMRLSADAVRHLGQFQPGDNYTADWTFRALLGYETPCHCAGFLLGTDVPLRNGKLLRPPTIRILIDLKSLGSVSAF